MVGSHSPHPRFRQRRIQRKIFDENGNAVEVKGFILKIKFLIWKINLAEISIRNEENQASTTQEQEPWWKDPARRPEILVNLH